ncbi:MAG: formimidoylglutamase [Chthoniobacterales bacterium]|nr:formimidoylglutamase [Chthoniobacterales bacterium]
MMLLNSKYYEPPTSSSWKGREDTVNGRLFQQIQLLDCNKLPSSLPKKCVVLLGFACDEGVKRNLGRPGAAQGPEAFRKALANLPLAPSQARPIYDAGNILCPDQDLEKAQQFLGETVAALRKLGAFVIVLGGGHEVAWGNFQGLLDQEPISTLNFDAHFDLRPLLPENRGSSGTSFSQIHDACQRKKIPWCYACFGIQAFGNTKEIFEKAHAINATHCLAKTMIHHADLAHETLGTWLSSAQQIHLTLCLDVLASVHAPGVSSPQALGITPHELLPFFRQALESGKVIGFDIAELNPLYDRDDQTAKLAAHFVAEVIHHYV